MQTMPITIEELSIGNQPDTEYALDCPHCGGPHLHQGHVKSIDDHEYIAIAFWCDSCWKGHQLVFEQHEGCTYVRWRAAPQYAYRKAENEVS
jgi:hypothetical protein